MANTADSKPAQPDDAPPVASRRHDVANQAGEALVGEKGDTIVGYSVTIDRPRSELYAFWRDLPNLATFMENVERIDRVDDRRSHWVVKAPGGSLVEWDAIITDDRDGHSLAWTSTEGSDVSHSGRVEFLEAGMRGTVVSATILYDPPGGAMGKVIAKLFQREPAIQARRDLRRFKQLMETGEIATGARNATEYEKRKG